MSIFISIASYCDPILEFTIAQAVANARWPDALHFGVVDQSPASRTPFDDKPFEPARVSYMRIDPVYARGPCWARAIAMSLYDGEDWFFQIDSHTDFDPHWDETLVTQAAQLMATSRASAEGTGVVVTAYPNPFVFEEGRPVHRPATNKVLAHVVKRDAAFAPDHPVLSFEAHPIERDEAVPGFHLAAGCLFAPGTIVQAFPYDPWFYFHGEEQALAARLFTHGWDIFHMPGLPAWHLYNVPGSGAPPRPLHWDAAHDSERSRNWWLLEERSRHRLAALLAGEPLGAFGLGTMRTMADYAAFSGIDFEARTIGPQAFDAMARLG